MAITFNQVPETYCPGFNPMIFVASSSAAHNTQFRFNSTIYDASATAIAAFVNTKQPTTGDLILDVHRTVENYLSYDITNLINQNKGWKYGVNVWKKYYVNVIEEYPQLVFHASGNSSSIYAVNCSMDWNDYVLNGLGGRQAASSSRQWMTNQPTRIKIRIDDSYELGTIASSANAVYYLKVEAYDITGSLLKTATIRNYNYSLADDSHRFPSILVGPDDLNATTLTTGTQTLIGSTCYYYRVATFNTIDVQTLRWVEFEVDRSCTRDDTYQRLFWLNPMGRFDAYNFDFLSDDNIEVTKARYDKLLGVVAQSSFTFNTYQQKTSVFHSKIKQSYKIRSGYIDNDTAIWLKELISSPLVYLIVNGSFVAVTVDDSTYQAKKTEKEKLFNVELTISLSVESQRQRL